MTPVPGPAKFRNALPMIAPVLSFRFPELETANWPLGTANFSCSYLTTLTLLM